jgi:hypothetical protein
MTTFSRNNSLFLSQQLLTDFGDLSSTISFEIDKGGDFQKVGLHNKGLGVRCCRQLLTTFNVSYPEILPQRLNALIAKIALLRGRGHVALFSDPSDNFIYDWEVDNIKQKGILVPIVNTLDSFRAIKVYQAADLLGYRPIYGFANNAEILVNNSATGFTVDRATGIFTGNLGGATIETDNYFIPAYLDTDLTYSTYYARGMDFGNQSSIPVVDEEYEKQSFKAEFTVKETKLKADFMLSHEIISAIDTSPNNKIKMNLENYQNDSSISFESRINTFENKGLRNAHLIPNTSTLPRKLSIPSRIVKHRDLIYWSTIYRATGGTSFELPQ